MHGNQEIYKHQKGAFFDINGILLKSFYYIYKEEGMFLITLPTIVKEGLAHGSNNITKT